MPFAWKKRIEKTTRRDNDNDISDVSFFHCSFINIKLFQFWTWNLDFLAVLTPFSENSGFFLANEGPKDQSIYSSIYLVGVSHKYWQCHSWVAVSQTLKFLPLALVRNDIVYSPPARRQCHSLLEQEEEISMSARLPPRNGPLCSHHMWCPVCTMSSILQPMASRNACILRRTRRRRPTER